MSKKGENIYKRKDGRWEGRYKCGFNDNGKTKYRSVYSKTYKECKEKLSRIKAEHNENRAYVKVEMTIKDISSAWLKNISINVKKSTYDTYCLIVNNHIVAYMGGMRADCVTAEYLNGFVSDKVKKGRKDGKGGLSCKTVQNIVGVLKSIFKYAEKIYGMKNPTTFVTVPKADKKEPEVLTQNEINKIRKYCNEHPDYFKYIFELCLSTGIRIGELCALQCGDVDLQEGILIINKTVQRVKKDAAATEGRTEVVITSPKTKNSVRKIPIPERLIEVLKDLTFGKKSSDYLFSKNGKKALDVRSVQKKFASVLNKCGIRKVKFHIIRHTFATKWAASNFDIKSLSEILGHSNVKITLSLYVHSSIETKRKHINELFAA